jgi:hypothetical protein
MGLGAARGPGFPGGPPGMIPGATLQRLGRTGGSEGTSAPVDTIGGGPAGPPPAADRSGPGGPGGPPPGGGPPGFFRPSSPELEALRAAIEQKASGADLRAKIAAVKAAREHQQAELQKAQDDLRQILSVRQEAVAVTMGLL